MTDDFDIPDDEDDDEDEEQRAPLDVLKELWEKPAVKLVVFAAGFVIILSILFNYFGPSGPEVAKSVIRESADLSQVPGEDVSPAYSEAITQQNERLADIAEQRGGSALPTPVSTPKQKLDAPLEPDVLPDDPLKEWRRVAELRELRPIPEPESEIDPLNPEFDVTPVVQPLQPEIQQAPVREDLLQLMVQQMDTIIATRQPVPAQTTDITDLQKVVDRGSVSGDGGLLGDQAQTLDEEEAEAGSILVTPGTIIYGQLLTALDSSVPGPALTQILSGRFAGGRMLGSFEKAERHLVVTFDTLIYKDDVYSINAIAMDPDTTLTGLVTDIDNHYFVRVILPAAAEFISGVAEGIAETNQTNVTVGAGGGAAVSSEEELDTQEELAKGVEAAGEEIADFLDEEADSYERTIKVAAGTPMGILFIQAVREGDAQQ